MIALAVAQLVAARRPWPPLTAVTASEPKDPASDDEGDDLVCSPGEVYAGYQIVKHLAAGGTCQIFEAQHAIMRRRVAMKVQKAHLRANTKRSHRIASEAMALAAIDHPNVVRIYHADVDERIGLYIIMELLEGRDLRKVIDDLAKSGRRLALKVATAIILEIADAIGAFHRIGIIHRDLKPDNIFLHERGPGDVLIKLLDLGIAKLPKGVSKTTDKHITVGTLPYMAPEQLTQGIVSPQSDVYALALVFDEMLSGVHAFSPGRSVLNPSIRDSVIRSRIIGGIYDRLDVRVPGFPRPIANFVARCLSLDPVQRPVSTQAFSDELRKLVRASEELRSDEHPIGKGPRHGITPPQPLVQRASEPPALHTTSQPPRPAQGGTLPNISPRLTQAQNELPPFAIPLPTRLDCWSFVLVQAPGAWRHLRIPVRLKPQITTVSRGVLQIGGGGDVPLPGMPALHVIEDFDADLRLLPFGAPVSGHDPSKPLRPYATFSCAAYTFMLVPPTPDGLGIPPDYENITVPRTNSPGAPALLVKAGHKAVLNRMFLVNGALVRLGGLVDLDAPLFRMPVPLAASLRWQPQEEAFKVTEESTAVRIRIHGAGSDNGLLTPYGSIVVDDWELAFIPMHSRRP